MELKDKEAADVAIREEFVKATEHLVDHLINQNMMSNQKVLDALRIEFSACQRAAFEYHEVRLNQAIHKGLTEDEKRELREMIKKAQEAPAQETSET